MMKNTSGSCSTRGSSANSAILEERLLSAVITGAVAMLFIAVTSLST